MSSVAATLPRPSVAEVAGAIARIPSFPPSVRAVLAACRRDDVGAEEIADLVMADQGLTAGVLRLANSAAHAGRGRIATVSDAVILLGTGAISGLVISVHAANLLDGPLPGYVMARGDLRRHSQAVALMAGVLPGASNRRVGEEAYVAGILHDIGKLVLSDVIGSSYEVLVRTAAESRRPLHRCERELIGFDHAEVGGRLAAVWGFPAPLVGAIGCHHRPEDTGEAAREIVHRVAVADTIVNALDAGLDASEAVELLDPHHLAELDLEPSTLVDVVVDLAPAISSDSLGE